MSALVQVHFPVLVNSLNSDSKNCSVFVVQSSKPIVVSTDKPLSSKFINTTIRCDEDLEQNYEFLRSQYDAERFVFDSAFSSSNSNDMRYFNEICLPCLKQMPLGKSSCFLSFGPTSAVKSSLLLHPQNGAINRSLTELTQLVNDSLEVYVAAYAHSNDSIFDLTNYTGRIIVKPSEVNIKISNDLLTYLERWESNRKELEKALGLLDQQTDLIISLRLKLSDNEISRYNFIDMAGSEYGLKLENDQGLFCRDIYDNINAIGNSLFCAASDNIPAQLSMLISSLGDSMTSRAHAISFCTTVISDLYPSINNIKALKFASWIRGQVQEIINKNINYQMNSSHLSRQESRLTNLKNERINTEPQEFRQVIQQQENSATTNNIRANRENAQLVNQGLTREPKRKDSNEESCDANRPYESMTNDINLKIKKLQKSKEEVKESLSKRKDKEFIERTVTELVNKELSKQSKSKLNNNDSSVQINTSNQHIQSPQLIDENKVLNFELEHLKQENITLRNDNIIFREDVNRLSEICSCLESELEFSRKKK